MKHILAAIDGSEASFRALTHASKLSNQLNAELTIVIVQLIIVSRKAAYPALSPEEMQSIQEQAKEIVRSHGCTDAKVLTPKSRDTAYAIVDTAIEEDADLVVMGASGKSGFKTFFLGSTSQEVLKKSACPVTIVH